MSSTVLAIGLVCTLVGLCRWLIVEARLAKASALDWTAIRNQQRELARLQAALGDREQVEAASAAKTRFLANVTHEVRTPLVGILGLTDLLSATQVSREQAAYIEAIRDSGSALASLINDILDFSRIEASKLDLTVEAFNPVVLMEGVVELMAPAAQAKKLEIAAMSLGQVPSLLLGDPARLRQVLLNLVGNAVKFTEKGGVGIILARHGDSVEFSIRDTGPGVPEGRRSAIFQEFEQADDATAQKHGGSGLGLAIARRLALAMDGQLDLLGSTPAGSEFRVRLPLLEPASDVPALDGDHVPETQVAALIVANTHFEAAFLGSLLRDLGLSPEFATGSDEACARLAHSPAPGLIIADCALGTTNCQAVLAAAARAGVAKKLILFSPAERHEFGQAMTEGYTGWLVKPVRSASLRRLVTDGPLESTLPHRSHAHCQHLGLNVLLAEDNDINALVAARQLQRMGAKVTRATDGPSAVAMARRALLGEAPPYDLVLLDMRMPGLDGHEVAKAIRQMERESGLPAVQIIGLTASAGQARQSADVDRIMVKPLDINLLSHLLTPGAKSRHRA